MLRVNAGQVEVKIAASFKKESLHRLYNYFAYSCVGISGKYNRGVCQARY